MTDHPVEAVKVTADNMLGYAVGIAMTEAVSRGELTDENARKIEARSAELMLALAAGKYINPDTSKLPLKFWTIGDEPHPDADFSDPEVLEIGG